MGFLSNIGSTLFGSKGKTEQVPAMTKEQNSQLMQVLQQLDPSGQLGQAYTQAIGGMQDFMDPSSEAMQRFSDPYMRQFEQETIPGIAERFAGAGAMGGGLSSSGFGQALSSAAGNLQSQLASMKTGVQRQAMGDIMNQYGNMTGQAFQAQPFAIGRRQSEPGLLGHYAQSGFPGFGSMVGSAFGGPMGGAAGGAASGIISRLMSGFGR